MRTPSLVRLMSNNSFFIQVARKLQANLRYTLRLGGPCGLPSEGNSFFPDTSQSIHGFSGASVGTLLLFWRPGKPEWGVSKH